MKNLSSIGQYLINLSIFCGTSQISGPFHIVFFINTGQNNYLKVINVDRNKSKEPLLGAYDKTCNFKYPFTIQ